MIQISIKIVEDQYQIRNVAYTENKLYKKFNSDSLII